ncbi:cagA exotoxin family protein [Neorickettsia helminthoeca str. Oregon]|uniref:CagA exotoxin family protein n=1 Tax=Neorickettsia helminthoeca str. Oregon TaxID=1286528 RepID=X5GXG0_9RICK|nr:type IV secretion system protein [Neorickettsia helminthoeca]AHX11742.1 cagA exotoxin family protein [Neorickettsia helminthoeca str. Oregon]
MRKVIALILLLFLFNGCDIECVYPGDGINANLSKIDVPAYSSGMDPKKVETLWIDSGVTIHPGIEAIVSVSGEIDLCGKVFNTSEYEECPDWNCSIVEVSNIFCVLNSPSPGIYNPSNLRDPKNKRPLCDNTKVDTDGYYVNTNLGLSPGEKVLFEPVPVLEVDLLDCANIPQDFTWYTNDDFKDSKNKDILSKSGKKLDPISICKEGVDLEVKRGNTMIPLQIPAATTDGLKYSAIVDNGYTPRSNRVIVGESTGGWIDAAEVDMRFAIPSILSDSSFCNVAFGDQSSLDPRKEMKQMSPEYKYFSQSTGCDKTKIAQLKRFNTYKVNRMCGNLKSDGPYGNGIYSIRYDEIVDPSNPCFRGRRRNNSGAERAWADLLVAKIGKPRSSRFTLQTFNDEAQQCIYSTGNGSNTAANVKKCIDINQYNGKIPSLELYEWYTVPDNVAPGSPLLMGIAGKPGLYSKNIYSGYRIRVRKSCSHQNGENLYIYIGNTPPTVAPGPGQSNVHSLHFKSDAKKRAVINPDSVDPGTYSISLKGSGKVYLGVYGASTSSVAAAVKTGKYLISDDNKYRVEITTEEWYPNFSGPFQEIYKRIMRLFYGRSDIGTTGLPRSDGIIVQIYKLVAERLAPSVQPFIVLYLITYGLSFLLGIIRDPRSDVVMRVAKIAFILLLVSDYSWHFFGETIFNLFINSSNELIYYFTGNLSGKYAPDNTFEFLDRTAGVILTNQFWLRMLALFLAGPAGWLVMAIILWGVFLFFSCIIEAMIVYLMILIATGLLFLLAPLFIAFLLFQRTKPLFEGWLKMLISFALRPIFIFGTLALLNAIMMAALYGINNFGVCPGCILSTDIFGDDLCIIRSLVPLGFDAEMMIEGRVPLVTGEARTHFMGLPLSFIVVIVFLLVAHAMKSFLKITDSMVDMITNTMMGYTGSAGGGSPSDAGHQAYQAMLSVVGMDDATQSEIKRAVGGYARSKRNIELKAVEPGKVGQVDNKAPDNDGADGVPRKDVEGKPDVKLEAADKGKTIENPIYESGDPVQGAESTENPYSLRGAEGQEEPIYATVDKPKTGEGMVENPIYESGDPVQGAESTENPYSLRGAEGQEEPIYATVDKPKTGEGMVENPIYESGDPVQGAESTENPYSLRGAEGQEEPIYATVDKPKTGEGMVENPIYESGDPVQGAESTENPYSLRGAEGQEEPIYATVDKPKTGEGMVENPIYESGDPVQGAESTENPQKDSQEGDGDDEGK